MKPMTNPRAAEILHQRVRFLEHHFPTHPANQASQREEIYALQLGIAALNEQEFNYVREKASQEAAKVFAEKYDRREEV